MNEPPVVLDLPGFEKELAAMRDDSIRPWSVALAPGELKPLHELCRDRRLRVIDSIDRQLAELAAVRLPAGSTDERERLVERLRSEAGGIEALGRWVWLPSQGSVSHLLGPDDYFDVIVSRNQDKVTRDEQATLRTKRIGVIGLSVGGEAAVTVAQEHLCGEIVLADFDCLDLSNLNRLSASFNELGDNKARIVARRIANIDPYLDVEVYDTGVNPDNMDSFLDGLDLLIEECDDLRTKFDVRSRARDLGLDVIYAADERGFLSVEPYSREPELAPFHGRVTEPQAARDAFASSIDFWKALTEWLGGWQNISTRSQASLERIGESLCGYPQLASEARFAAGQLGHVARRLLCGEPVRPFVGNVDLQAIVQTAEGFEAT